MPTSSASTTHISSQPGRRLRSTREGQATSTRSSGNPSSNSMKPRQESKKTSNGSMANKEKVVRYRECRKNHAANIGGYAVDGCREFMAAGEEGTSDALRCAACSCHRSFHKREVEAEAVCECSSNSNSWR